MARQTTPKPTPPAAPAETEMMKKPALFDEVVTRTNLKKRDVKPAVEAALAVIADTLREGTDVNLPPLGKLRVVKSKDLENGASVITLKLRTPKNATAAASGVDADGSAT
ncbi:HU family DNA-binding protein [Loktanella sp. Alg231-35]|uniref:HU family DNA-binding protein n=1 Tax=Loktanella sp. Alg231-35 TaxID=1922220 RepID=UPI000D55AD23|nr:HU family DNA-binding protein [Loktanella sp. Alg231-35]